MAREPMLMAACGKKGVGKSYQHMILMNQYVQGDYYRGVKGRKCLIMDVNDEYGYGTYGVQSISLGDVPLFTVHPKIEIRRIRPFHPNGARMTLDEWAQALFYVLNIFQNEVKKNNGKFFVIVFPDKNNINYFEKTIKDYNLKINYFILDSELAYSKELFFINDGHWNEKGNLFFAKNLEKIFDNSGIHFNKKIDENIIISNINNYYKN